MGKGDRKTKARQARKRFEAMAGVALAEAPRKPKQKKQGRARMAEIDQEKTEDAQRQVLSARARRMGRDDSSPHVRAEMAGQIHGEPAGEVLTMICAHDEAARLFGAYRAFSGAYERYTRRVLQSSPHAKCGKIEMQPEKLETSADAAPPDLRSDDERHRAAINAWQSWKAALAALSVSQSAAIWTAFHSFTDLHKGGAPTPAGKRFVEAMRVMCRA